MEESIVADNSSQCRILGSSGSKDGRLPRQDYRGPSTIDSIARSIHIVAHGTMNPETQRGSLVLEDNDGHRAFAFDDDLYPWIHPDLRVVVLQSCHSAAPTPKLGPPFVGIGPRLVQLGVPAVVAMQDYVAMDDARLFAAAFYRSLVQSGLVDVAARRFSSKPWLCRRSNLAG